MRRLLPLLLLALGACFGGQQSPFVRITTREGRVHYTRYEYTIHSSSGGFITFRDLVTREEVRLKNGSYRAAGCPQSEVEAAQREYIDDPSKPPMD